MATSNSRPMVENRITVGRQQLLQDLYNAVEVDTCLAFLKTIKNDLIGHESRKAQYIRYGILPIISKILIEVPHDNGEDLQSTNIHTQAIISVEAANIVCLLAHEGPAFVQPILESGLLAKFLERLKRLPPPIERLAILRCINAVLEQVPPSAPGQWSVDERVTDLLFKRANVGIFAAGVQQAGGTAISQQICDSTITLLCKICKVETQRRSLVDSGLLSLLTQRLASFIVSEGFVIPLVESFNDRSHVVRDLPDAAPSHAHLSPTLEAISLLIQDSKDHAEHFLKDETLLSVLPVTRDHFSPSDVRQAPWGNAYLSGTAITGSRSRNVLDSLIPFLPASEKSSSINQLNFPPLGSGVSAPKRRTSFQPSTPQPSAISTTPEKTDEQDESPVIPWLLFMARESKHRRRLLACKLLVILFNLGLVSQVRYRSFGGLLVPILTGMLDQGQLESEDQAAPSQLYLSDGMHYSRAAPAVLALLIMDDPALQKVAVDAKAIARLSLGLKRTFEEPLGRKTTPWKPQKAPDSAPEHLASDQNLGIGGPSQSLRNDMKYREGTLQALGAIAPFNDEYRKQICDQGILPQIMLALEPFHLQDNLSVKNPADSVGNSTSTILAACGAVRALTRSVTALRTKLVDADVTKSIIKLMNNTDPEVRIAATKVLANLAMYLSPMKDSVGETAVVKKLCEQAHSANARLRLESIWALKQLVVNAPKELKQEIINELGSSWIKLLIKTDPYDIPPGEVIGLVDKDYPPQPTRSVTSQGVSNSEDVVMSEDSDNEQSDAGTDSSSPFGISREDTFNKHSPEDDLAIQEQVLDLLRNLFCGENASDIVDYVLGEMGKDDFFKILLARLRSKTVLGATRKENQTILAHSGIVLKVICIVSHIAACSQKWRTAVAKEQGLLRQILTFTSHLDRLIRSQCCWLAINLMYEDEVSDRISCKQRAVELQKIGFFAHLRRLENDIELDVRERAKTAVHLMTNLITS